MVGSTAISVNGFSTYCILNVVGSNPGADHFHFHNISISVKDVKSIFVFTFSESRSFKSIITYAFVNLLLFKLIFKQLRFKLKLELYLLINIIF